MYLLSWKFLFLVKQGGYVSVISFTDITSHLSKQFTATVTLLK